jgi:hypothetical protein
MGSVVSLIEHTVYAMPCNLCGRYATTHFFQKDRVPDVCCGICWVELTNQRTVDIGDGHTVTIDEKTGAITHGWHSD